jgi:hypothetical protein
MVMSPGGRQVSWLFFKAVRAGLAVKRPYLDSYGSSPATAGRKNSQLAAVRRVALKMPFSHGKGVNRGAAKTKKLYRWAFLLAIANKTGLYDLFYLTWSHGPTGSRRLFSSSIARRVTTAGGIVIQSPATIMISGVPEQTSPELFDPENIRRSVHRRVLPPTRRPYQHLPRPIALRFDHPYRFVPIPESLHRPRCRWTGALDRA